VHRQLCEGILDGAALPRALLPPSDFAAGNLRRGVAVEVACAHCLRSALSVFGGEGADAGAPLHVDLESIDWLPAWVVASPRGAGAPADVLHEDGTVEAAVAQERLRRPGPQSENQFGAHQDWGPAE